MNSVRVIWFRRRVYACVVLRLVEYAPQLPRHSLPLVKITNHPLYHTKITAGFESLDIPVVAAIQGYALGA